MSKTDWCDEADDWGMADEDQENVSEINTHTDPVQTATDVIGVGMDVSSKLQGLCIDEGADHQNMPTFQSFYISVMEETDIDGFYDTDHENELLRQYEESEGLIVGR